jgi:hypothetical protein
MTAVARRVRSVPVRLASETWVAICDMVAAVGTPARSELDAIANVAAMLISEQYTAAAPIIISGAGPRIRVYTLHGNDAIDADDDGPPVYSTLEGDGWSMSLPARQPDVNVARSLIQIGGRVAVRDLDEVDETEPGVASKHGVASIDLEELSRL